MGIIKDLVLFVAALVAVLKAEYELLFIFPALYVGVFALVVFIIAFLLGVTVLSKNKEDEIGHYYIFLFIIGVSVSLLLYLFPSISYYQAQRSPNSQSSATVSTRQITSAQSNAIKLDQRKTTSTEIKAVPENVNKKTYKSKVMHNKTNQTIEYSDKKAMGILEKNTFLVWSLAIIISFFILSILFFWSWVVYIYIMVLPGLFILLLGHLDFFISNEFLYYIVNLALTKSFTIIALGVVVFGIIVSTRNT